MMQIYRYHLSKLVKRIMPPRWRNPFNLNWFECLLSQINYSQDRFNAFKEQTLIELAYNGTTLMLQKMLNDKFDPIQRRILIVHDESTYRFLYNEDEFQAEQYLYNESETGATPTYLYAEGEDLSTLPDGIDFQVQAPMVLSSEETEITKAVNKYKLAGRQFEIIFS